MSKKLFLAAASVAALALAGGANAGEISGKFGSAGTFTKTAAYTVANELIVDEDNVADGVMTVSVALSNDVTIPSGAQRDHLVKFTVTGADFEPTSLVANNNGTAVSGATASFVSNVDGVVTYILTIAAATIDELVLTGNVEQTAKADITVSSDVKAVIGASEIPVDTGAAVKAATYAPLLGSLALTTPHTLTATLNNDYTTFGSASSGTLATGFKFVNTGSFHSDLDDTTVTAAGILNGGKLTVVGPLISEDVAVGTIGTLDTTTTAGNTAVFNLTAGEADTLSAGAQTLTIRQTAADADDYVQFRAGTYSVSWAPTAKTGFTVPSASSVDAGKVALEGTNFVAPWVSGTGAATSVVRISNSNATDSGAVSVRLISAVKVAGGVATPYSSDAVLNLEPVKAGADIQITSKQLTDAFGDFTRGDIQVTINSSTDGFTAKMRNTRDGASFEQSLDSL